MLLHKPTLPTYGVCSRGMCCIYVLTNKGIIVNRLTTAELEQTYVYAATQDRLSCLGYITLVTHLTLG